MKEKHIAGWITAALILIVGALSFPYVWFKIEAKDFTEHKFPSAENVRISIDAYQKDTETELADRRSKNVVLSALRRELEYTGPLWYTTPMQIRGEDEIYCIRIYDQTGNGGSWRMYVSDNSQHNYLHCGEVFNAKFAVSTELLQILNEYTDV